jgi:5-methylcytosine-specific restriction protein A
MVAWFSQKITTGESPWAPFFDRQKQGEVWSYRPQTAAPSPIRLEPDVKAAIEGDPRLYFHFQRERDKYLVAAKRNASRRSDGLLECEACGFVVSEAYPNLPGDLCEVHHRRSLAEAATAVETRLEDLAVLCPNCHRAIHRTKPLMSVEEFRSRFLGAEQTARPQS